MNAPKLTAAQWRVLTGLVFVGRRLEVLTRGQDKRVCFGLVALGFAEVQESEFGPCFAASPKGKAEATRSYEVSQ